MSEISNNIDIKDEQNTLLVDEVLKNSTLNNPELTFCEKTTYLDFLLSNAQSDEEEAEIKSIVNDFLEIYPHLNEEDLLFCILSALHFRKRLICYCMKTTSGALRARKNRLKRNLAEDTFQMIFENHKIA